MPVADRLSETDPAAPGDRRFLQPHPEISHDGRPGRTGEQPHCARVERLTNYLEIAAHNAAYGITGDSTDRLGPQGSPVRR